MQMSLMTSLFSSRALKGLKIQTTVKKSFLNLLR